jgi:deazaflavin-dependent oxidoreductase (nitroreductase family)
MTETRPANTMKDINSDVVEQFRTNHGTIQSGMFSGARLLLLTTTGAKSGKTRVNPLAFTRDGEDYVIIASKGGSPTHPDWYHNLVANRDVTVEVGNERFAARARVAQGAERDRLYAAQASIMPGFAEYQRNTTRQIPVVVLQRRQTRAQPFDRLRPSPGLIVSSTTRGPNSRNITLSC